MTVLDRPAVTVTPSADLAAALDALPSVELADLVGTAELLTRRDRKYLVPAADLATVLHRLPVAARVLTIDDRRLFAYRSVYFDTPDLESYLGAARRRPDRFKVRTRRYLDTDTCMLEVKTRDRRGRTVKRRIACDPAEEEGLSNAGRSFVATIARTATVVDGLRPTLTTSYRRATVLLDVDPPARVTIDTGLAWAEPSGERLEAGRFAIVETKTTGRPCAMDQVLWSLGHRPVKISKYCTGLAALEPHLPANKWHRVLGRLSGSS